TFPSGFSSAGFLSSFWVWAGSPLVNGFGFFFGSSAGAASAATQTAAADSNQRVIRGLLGTGRTRGPRVDYTRPGRPWVSSAPPQLPFTGLARAWYSFP